MGMAALSKVADILRIAIPLLRGAEAEEAAVKMLSIAIRAVPASMPHGGQPMPQQSQGVPMPPHPAMAQGGAPQGA